MYKAIEFIHYMYCTCVVFFSDKIIAKCLANLSQDFALS